MFRLSKYLEVLDCDLSLTSISERELREEAVIVY